MAFAAVVWAFKDVVTSSKLAQMVQNIIDHDHRDDGSQGAPIRVRTLDLDAAPTAVSVTTTPATAMTATVPSGVAYRVSATAQVELTYTQTGRVSVSLYQRSTPGSGGALLGEAEYAMVAGAATSCQVIGKAVSISSGSASRLIEVVVTRLTGTGSLTSSTSTSKNTLACLCIPT